MATGIKDIARLCGVSPATVSRVLSGNARVSEETRRKILHVIKETHYHPNAIARSLVEGSTRTIGLVLCTNSEIMSVNTFFVDNLMGISTYMQEHDYNVMVTFSADEEQALLYIKNYIRAKQVDGIILFVSRRHDKCIEYLQKVSFPFVVIGKPEDAENCLWVDNNNQQAACEATNYLIERHHRRIGFICGSSRFVVSMTRLSGYKKALSDASIPYDEAIVYNRADFTVNGGFHAAQSIFENLPPEQRPTAIIGSDDLQAIGVLQYADKNQIRNLSVIGFNNITLSAFTSPALTTVDTNANALGTYAAKLMIEHLKSKRETYGNFLIGTSIVERDSVKNLSERN